MIRRDQEAAAKALGYESVEDATDYRNTGAQDRAFEEMTAHFEQFRIAETAVELAALTIVKAEAHALEAVLQAIYSEGLTNHNTRCKPWWIEVLRALGKLEP